MAHADSEAMVAEAEPGAMPAAEAPDLGALPTGTPVALDSMAQRAPPDNLPPEVGSTIEHYELLCKLGEGGMGTVYVGPRHDVGPPGGDQGAEAAGEAER